MKAEETNHPENDPGMEELEKLSERLNELLKNQSIEATDKKRIEDIAEAVGEYWHQYERGRTGGNWQRFVDEIEAQLEHIESTATAVIENPFNKEREGQISKLEEFAQRLRRAKEDKRIKEYLGKFHPEVPTANLTKAEGLALIDRVLELNQKDIDRLKKELVDDDRTEPELGEIDWLQALADIKQPKAEKEPVVEKVETLEPKNIGEKLRAGFEALVTHGEIKDGVLIIKPDLDGLVAIEIFNLAGINYNQIDFVPKGKRGAVGGVHVDTGGRPETTMEDDGSVFFDHHGPEKGESTSAAQLVYETLIKEGLLAREPWLDELVKFVTEVDNLSYNISKKDFETKWANTLYGCYRQLPIAKIIEFFKAGHDPYKKIPEEFAADTVTIKGTPLNTQLEKNQKIVAQSLAGIRGAIRTMKTEGLSIESPLTGKTLINIVEGKNKIPLGATAVKACGYDTYIAWHSETNSFFVSAADTDLKPIFELLKTDFPDIKIIRGTMIVMPPSSEPIAGKFDLFVEKLGLKTTEFKAPKETETLSDKEVTTINGEKLLDQANEALARANKTEAEGAQNKIAQLKKEIAEIERTGEAIKPEIPADKKILTALERANLRAAEIATRDTGKTTTRYKDSKKAYELPEIKQVPKPTAENAAKRQVIEREQMIRDLENKIRTAGQPKKEAAPKPEDAETKPEEKVAEKTPTETVPPKAESAKKEKVAPKPEAEKITYQTGEVAILDMAGKKIEVKIIEADTVNDFYRVKPTGLLNKFKFNTTSLISGKYLEKIAEKKKAAETLSNQEYLDLEPGDRVEFVDTRGKKITGQIEELPGGTSRPWFVISYTSVLGSTKIDMVKPEQIKKIVSKKMPIKAEQEPNITPEPELKVEVAPEPASQPEEIVVPEIPEKEEAIVAPQVETPTEPEILESSPEAGAINQPVKPEEKPSDKNEELFVVPETKEEKERLRDQILMQYATETMQKTFTREYENKIKKQLDQLGYQLIIARPPRFPGEYPTFPDPRIHEIVGITPSPEQHDQVAALVVAGFKDKATGKVTKAKVFLGK